MPTALLDVRPARLLAAALICVCTDALAAPPNAPALAQQDGESNAVLSESTAALRSPSAQRLALDVYENLRRARSAIDAREVTLLRVALGEAHDDLTLLALPADEAEIQDEQSAAERALDTPGERDQWASFDVEQLDTNRSEDEIQTQRGWLPLKATSTQIKAASSAADTETPNWTTAETAVKAALGGIRWVSASPENPQSF